jgi:hypothetical protein
MGKAMRPASGGSAAGAVVAVGGTGWGVALGKGVTVGWLTLSPTVLISLSAESVRVGVKLGVGVGETVGVGVMVGIGVSVAVDVAR